MLTKKQRWRRVRVVRANSNSSNSSNDSTSGGGGGADACAGRDGFDCFPALASSSPLINSTPSGNNSNGGASPPQCRHALDSTTADPARPEGSSDSKTLRPPQPPPPLPSPLQEATTPHDATSSPGSNRATEAQAAKPPPTFFPGGAQEQRGGGHHHDNLFAAEAAPARSHPLEAWRVSALNLVKFLFFFDASGIEDGRTRRDAGGFGGWGSGGGGGRDRSATEGCHPFAATPAAARPRRPSEPGCRPPPSLPMPKAVRFSNQIRVVLVASRLELSSMKTDIWWGERDYCDFRRAYFKAAREEKESDGEVTPPSRAGQGTPGQDEFDRPGSSPVATSPTTATSAGLSSSRSGSAVAAHDDDDDLLSKPSCGSRGDGGYDSDCDDSGGCSRASQAVLPRPPPPSPEHQTHEPHVELDDAGVLVGVKRLSGLLDDQRVAVAGEWERENDGGGMTPPHAVNEQAGSSAAITSNAVETAVVAESTATVHADVFIPQQPKQAASPERREWPVLAKAAVVTPGTAPNVASVARGFPWREAGSRGDAAMRSPGSVAVGPARAEELACPRAAAEVRREIRRETQLPILETGRDPRIDPRTGARVPLPFLGSAPIRRVASF
ncbi:unnamed protein product [Ectocarpus sp. CCAP 1310/34]|nr:unnamed protein product [Ectocarpus sp. CCAP 1310/34]